MLKKRQFQKIGLAPAVGIFTRYFLDMRFSGGIRYCRTYYLNEISENFDDRMLRYGQKLALKMGFSPIFDHPRTFFKYRAVTFVPLGCPAFMQKFRQILGVVLDLHL